MDPSQEAGGPSALDAAELQAVFDAVPGVNLLLAADSPRFTMLLASDGRLEATMTSREGTLGRPLFKVFPDANPDNPEPSGVSNLRNSLETVLRTRAPHRMPVQRYDLRRADGSWEERYWSPLNAPVLGPDGQVRFLLHQVSDVTDEVRGRQALARSEQRAARILERMADAHFVLDRALSVVTLNAAAERLTDRTREDVIGKSLAAAFPESYQDATEAAYRRVVETGEEQHLQQHHVQDGRAVFLEVDAYTTDEGGVAIFARDVTERVRSGEIRRKGEVQRFLAQLGDALHASADAASVREAAVRLLADHLGATQVLCAEVDGDDDERFVVVAGHRASGAAAFVASGRFDDFGDRLARRLRTRRTVVVGDTRDLTSGDTATAAHPGDASPWRACIVAPTVVAGRLAGCIAVLQSTPRAWTSEEIALVQETAERARVAMARAQAESALRDADRRKDEFLAVLAHELRNPLAPVRNGLQILRLAGTDAPTIARTLGVMERQLVHMARLIDDLLDVSRITRGMVTLQRERLSLRAVIDSALEASRHLVDGSRHALTLHLPYEPLHLDADATRLAQVIGNLLNNAAKYTPDGGRIDLYAQREGDDVVIRVVDTGVGIPAPMLAHVFDMFAQVGGSSLERSQGGLGIGLSISKQLVLMHGGSIEVDSPGAGEGATFTVRLPLAPGSPAAESSPPAANADAAVAPLRVLVVDDNVDAADSFSTMLGLSGHLVRTAYSGAEALAVAAEFEPAFVFCDIGMPGMSGYEFARRIRADPALGHVGLVAVTGWGSEDDKRKSIEAGFDLHLAKPADWAAVREALALKR